MGITSLECVSANGYSVVCRNPGCDHPGEVCFELLFRNLGVQGLANARVGHGRFFPPRRVTLKCTSGLDPIGVADGHRVALRDKQFGRRMSI